MNENKFNTEQNIEKQPSSFNKSNTKKLNKKGFIVPLIIITIILFILFRDFMLQLLGIILMIVIAVIVILKAGKYTLSFGSWIFNAVIKVLAFAFILAGIGWVMELL